MCKQNSNDGHFCFFECGNPGPSSTIYSFNAGPDHLATPTQSLCIILLNLVVNTVKRWTLGILRRRLNGLHCACARLESETGMFGNTRNIFISCCGFINPNYIKGNKDENQHVFSQLEWFQFGELNSTTSKMSTAGGGCWNLSMGCPLHWFSYVTPSIS